VEAGVTGDDDLVGPVRALIGEEAGDPASHRSANDVPLLDAEGVLQLAQVVDDGREGVDAVEGVAGRPADQVGRDDTELGGKDVKSGEAVIGAALDARDVEDEQRLTGADVDVAGLAIAELDGLVNYGCGCHVLSF